MLFCVMGHIAALISLRRTDFASIYVFAVKSGSIQLLVIKGHNFDYFEIARKLK